MWSTWCSVLTRYWIGPCCSTASRIATAFVGSCGVSMTTGPFDVSTKIGLQPRTFVSVEDPVGDLLHGPGAPSGSYWVAVRPPSMPSVCP